MFRSYRFIVVSAALCAALTACAGGGGSGGSSSSGSGTSGGATVGGFQAGGAASNQSHWQTALAAMAQGGSAAEPVRMEPSAIATWNDLIRRNWPQMVPFIADAADAGLQGQLGQSIGGGFTLQAVHNLQLDFNAPPEVGASAPAPQQTLTVSIPGAPGTWAISFTATFQYGSSFPIYLDLDVSVASLRMVQPIDMDLADPDNVTIVGPGAPNISVSIQMSSPTPLVGTVASTISQYLDPIIRIALLAMNSTIQQQIGTVLSQLPQGPSFGHGGPPVTAVSGAQPLQPLAETISDDIQTHHMPFNHVFPATFDQPLQGGTAIRYNSHGDSAIWTGHYLASEAYRFDLNGDPRALQGATRATDGAELLLDVAGQGGGLLSRAAIPSSSPRVADMSNNGRFIGFQNGVQYDCKEIISRDQYIGIMLGLGQTFHRIPQLRTQAKSLITRVVTYLEGTDWVAQRADHQTVSVTFMTNPNVVLAFTKLAAFVDPGKFDAIHRSFQPLASIAWLSSWFSGRDVHESYYKFNLSHSTQVSLFEFETDPALYRENLKALRMTRTAIGHHQNAWFDAVYAMAVPPVAAAVAVDVKNELDHWALRPRRGHSVQNSQNPNIATTTVTSSLPNTSGGPAGGLVTTTRVRTVATTPLPIELRPPTDFLWQRDPFRLDGSHPVDHQSPGIDLTLPYWFARNHGILQ